MKILQLTTLETGRKKRSNWSL